MTKRVALVTGSGGRRIGNHVAEALARRGFAVAIHYHRSAESAAETAGRMVHDGHQVEMFAADVADEAQVDRMFRGSSTASGGSTSW